MSTELAVNFDAEDPFFDLFDAFTGKTLAAAGSFAVTLFIALFSPSFELESLDYSTHSDLLSFFLPFKDLRTAFHLLVGKTDGVLGWPNRPVSGLGACKEGRRHGDGRLPGPPQDPAHPHHSLR